MQLTDYLIRYCLLANIKPPVNATNSVEILDIFIESYNKGLMTTEQLQQLKDAHT